MHSVHQVQHQAQQHPNGPALSQHLHQEQQQQHEQEQQEKLNMTVLESLEPVQQQDAMSQQQPVLGVLDPVQQQIHQQQQQPIIHTLVPVSSSNGPPQPLGPPAGAHLHQLQPSRQPVETLHDQQHQEQQQHEQQEQQREDNSNSNAQRQPRPSNGAGQIEGIVADGGGPIVQWLLENYEIADGESLPRSTVYNHYLSHCRQLRMASVNAASFGKLIRSVFVGLKTRRLGTRGHSKYHYFGVRAKQHVRLDWLQQAESGESRPGCSSSTSNMMRDSNDNSNGSEANGSESDSTGNCSGRLSSSMSNSNHNGKRMKRSNGLVGGQDAYMAHHHDHQDHLVHDHEQHLNHHQQQQQHYDQSVMNPANEMYCPVNGYDEKQQQQDPFAAMHDERAQCWTTTQQLDQYDLSSFRNHLGPNRQTLVDESWPPTSEWQKQPTDKTINSNDLSPHLVEHFEGQYRAYYKRMVELLGELQFNEVERLWSEFWRPQAQGALLTTHETTSTVHWGMAHEQQQQLTYQQQNDSTQQQQQSQQPQQLIQLATNLTFEQLYQLTSRPAMIERINQIDCKLFAALESFLVVDMLSPLPRALVQHLRTFARNICAWTEQAIKDYHPSFVTEKMKSTRAFEQALRRYTSINHLSTASRAIWNKRSALVQMSIDLSRLDLRDIENQVSSLMSQEKSHHQQPIGQADNLLPSHELVNHQNSIVTGQNGDSMQQADQNPASVIKSPANEQHQQVPNMNHSANDNIENNYHHHHHEHTNINGSVVDSQQQQLTHQQTFINLDNQYSSTCANIQPAQLVQNFLHLLEDPYPANAWPDWCRSLVESRVCGHSFEEARNFILKWNFYISLILRELTLRSAPSLGSFQLIRLLFDEYMYHLVVARLAQAQHKTSTQLLRPSSKFGNI